MKLQVTNTFVEPHYIAELGEEGLTLHDIARSLGIEFKHAKEVISKNPGDYDEVEISTPSTNPINPTVISYALSVENAKLFVAQYRNEVGKAYCKFLIQVEKQARELAANPAAMFEGMSAEQLQIFSVVTSRLAEEQRKATHLAKVTDSALSSAAQKGRLLAEMERERDRLGEALGEAGMWLAAHAAQEEFPTLKGLPSGVLGKRLTKLSRDAGRKIKAVPTANPHYPRVNAYHRSVVERLAKQMGSH